MSLLDFLFGNKKKKIAEFVAKKAIILDVRSKEECSRGKINDSKNIPLQELNTKINEIKSWNLPVITCCESGGRSAMAKIILKKNGIEVMNGGGWLSLKDKLDKL